MQGVVTRQGTGVVGPRRPCTCGEQQGYQDQRRALTVQTSVGIIRLARRAAYQCPGCAITSYPLDEQLGLGQAGRMSRSLQEQGGWLLALVPARVAQQTLVRFGWPPVAASQIRKQGEALGAELEQETQERLAAARQEAAGEACSSVPVRQTPCGERLYAAPDGVLDCTNERDSQTGKVRWRELQVAAVYEARSGKGQAEQPRCEEADEQPLAQVSVRTRLGRWLREQEPTELVAAPDQAIRVTYVAETSAWEHLGPRRWLELWERGRLRPVRDLVVVADGSDPSDQVVDDDLRLPGIQLTRMLASAHAQEQLWAVSNVAFGQGSTAGAAWVQAPLTALERGQVEEVLNSLETLATQRAETAPEVAAVARKTASYFTRRRAQVEYPRFVAAGYQIGSGLAERACKRFGTDRMKGAGMRWSVTGAESRGNLACVCLE